MKILVCAATAPLPPLDGFRLQLRPVCEELAKTHDVTVLAYRWPDQYGEAPEGVELLTIDQPRPSIARRSVDWIRSRRPLGAMTMHRPMADAAKQLLERRQFDVLNIAGWNLSAIPAELPPMPAVLTALDASFLNYLAKSEVVSTAWRPLYRREARLVRRYERIHYPAFDSVVLVSDADAAALERVNPAINTTVIPNGVDTERFAPDSRTEPDPGLIVFTGAMQWAPNARAARFLAEEILPLVRARRPEARLALVGRSPGPEVMALARLENVEVTGEVEDVRDWLHTASIFACPMLSGTGIKNKLLEALATELACVASPLACQGIAARDGHELLVAETAEQHAAAIVSLLESPARARELAKRGRAAMVAEHSWAAVGSDFGRLLSSVASARAEQPSPSLAPGGEIFPARMAE